MADDLDDLLDSIPLPTPPPPKKKDLDAMLDELDLDAMIELENKKSAARDAAIEAKQKKKGGKGAAKGKASSAFVSTKKKVDSLMSGSPPSFLDEAGAAQWKAAMGPPPMKCPPVRQQPFSNAYKSFSIKAEAVTVHKGASANTEDDSISGSAPAVVKQPALRLYQTTLAAAVAAAGTIEPTMSTTENIDMKARLTRLYLGQVAKDVRPRLSTCSDFSGERFPYTSAKIMS